MEVNHNSPSSSPFVIEPRDLEAMQAKSKQSMEALLSSLVWPTRALARPPISGFFVGAVALGESGRVFRGVNLEFPGLPLNNSVHAEQFLVLNALQHGERQIRVLAVSAAPCGHCRQFLQEIRGSLELRILIVDDPAPDCVNDPQSKTLDYFLPHRFGPSDVLDGDFPLLLEPHANGLSLVCGDGHGHENSLHHGHDKRYDYDSHGVDGYHDSHSHDHDGIQHLAGVEERLNEPEEDRRDSRLDAMNGSHAPHEGGQDVRESEHRTDIGDESQAHYYTPRGKVRMTSVNKSKFDDLRNAALDAANGSHAPYTNSPAGVALLTKKGKIYSGSYVESVAYNPGLPPLQAALVAFVARDGGSYEDLTHAILVEKKEAPVQFFETAELLLKKIAPLCKLHVYHATLAETESMA